MLSNRLTYNAKDKKGYNIIDRYWRKRLRQVSEFIIIFHLSTLVVKCQRQTYNAANTYTSQRYQLTLTPSVNLCYRVQIHRYLNLNHRHKSDITLVPMYSQVGTYISNLQYGRPWRKRVPFIEDKQIRLKGKYYCEETNFQQWYFVIFKLVLNCIIAGIQKNCKSFINKRKYS